MYRSGRLRTHPLSQLNKNYGLLGTNTDLRFTEAQTLTAEDTTTVAPLLYSQKSTVNLLSRDLLCKLAATIHYSPTRLWVTFPDETSVGQQLLTEANKQTKQITMVLAGTY